MLSLAQKTTRERLFDACNSVYAQWGDLNAVTADRIYDLVEKGSRQTVLAVLREWKAAKSASPQLLGETAPAEVRTAATNLWEAAKVLAAREFEAQRLEFASQLEQAGHRVAEADSLARKLQRTAAERQSIAEGLSAELEAQNLQLQLSAAAYKQHIGSLEAQVRVALRDATTAVDAEKARSAKALEDERARAIKAEHAAQKAIERADRMSAKIEELSEELGRERALRSVAEKRIAS
jgi:hypothetical protein